MENETQKIKERNMFIPICITQIICIALILIVFIITKFFFTAKYQKIQKWCRENVFQETVINDVFEEEETSEI